MCRVLSYLGEPILIENLLYKPDNSFIKQSYHPIYMSHLLNLAGFGMVAWDEDGYNPALPFIYKTEQLPIYDHNLKNLTQKITPHCLLTHIRGVPYHEKQIVSKQNVHPFIYPNSQLAFAHNGALFNFEAMKLDLLKFIKPSVGKYLQGTTDSEWLYALLLSQLHNENEETMIEAILKMFSILKTLRYKHNIRVNSPLNLFMSNGQYIIATRFAFDYGWEPLSSEKLDKAHFFYHSLWYTYGEKFVSEKNTYFMKAGKKRESIIIASEPLTEDTTTWIEMPEYTILLAKKESQGIKIQTYDINL